MDKKVSLEIPAQPEFVRIVRLIAAGVGNAMRFNVEELDDLKLAVGEACYQAFQSGASPASRLRISAEMSSDYVDVEVCVSHSTADHGAYPGLEGLDRGIGLTLMKNLVDELSFSSNCDHTKIRFLKRRLVNSKASV